MTKLHFQRDLQGSGDMIKGKKILNELKILAPNTIIELFEVDL